MKKLNLIFLSILVIFAFASCDEGNVGPIANSDPGSPEITAPQSGQSFTLTEEQAADTVMTIEWTKPDFGFTAAPTYTVELAAAGNNFADPIEIASVQNTSYPIVVSDLNNMLLSEDFEGDQNHSMEMRVIASISDSASKAVSDNIAVTFTPYTVEISYPEIYVPGGYQGASNEGSDWDPGTAPALYSFEDDDTYEGYVYIANAGSPFKFTAERNWDEGDWGTSGTEGELESPGNDIVADEAGYYKMDVDLNELTYSLTNTEWAVTGDATPNGWANEDEGIADHDMEYDSENKVWHIDLNLSAGEIKFRANDAWNIEYGDNEGDGNLELAGGNIAVEAAGNYTIEFNLSEAPFSYTLTQN